jgi:pyroglutamyl-peptidase
MDFHQGHTLFPTNSSSNVKYDLMKLLLTGFEPFGGSNINPSEKVALALHGRKIGLLEIISTILPVDGEIAPIVLLKEIASHMPDAILSLGEVSHRPAISVERAALNLMEYRIADNRGNIIIDQSIRSDGPAAYFSTLPVSAIHNRLQEAGVPVELSLSAGAYLCNQVFYSLMDYLATHRMNQPAGFIHLPSLPEQVAGSDSPIPSMALETLIKGISLAIETISHSMQIQTKGRRKINT